MPDAIIFDLDGTLANSEPVHEQALRRAVEAMGMTLSHEQFETLCVGFGDLPALDKVARANGRELTQPQLEALSRDKHLAFSELLTQQGVPAFDGAVELFEEAARRTRIGVCSGSRRPTVESVLQVLGLLSLPEVITTLDDVNRGKPDPEPYLRTAELLKLKPSACIAIEDTPTGVASAASAGLRVVAVAHSVSASELGQAALVVNHISDLSLDLLLG